MKKIFTAFARLAGAAALAVCAGTGSASAQVKQHLLLCDLNGMQAQMLLNLEYVATSGVVGDPGSIPGIGVIGTGQYRVYTSGEVRSPSGYYVFTGEGQYAEFTDMVSYDRFKVQFVDQRGGLLLIINPFVERSRQGHHFCQYVR